MLLITATTLSNSWGKNILLSRAFRKAQARWTTHTWPTETVRPGLWPLYTCVTKMVKLSSCNRDHWLCIYINSSDTFRSGTTTQIPNSAYPVALFERWRTQFEFLPSRFSALWRCWSVVVKKAIVFFSTLMPLHWLSATPSSFDFCTNHNLILVRILYL